jgi:hypothetical protein
MLLEVDEQEWAWGKWHGPDQEEQWVYFIAKVAKIASKLYA